MTFQQHPLSRSELPQEWPIEMDKKFLMVPFAMGRDISFGELHITVGCDSRIETIQNAQCKIGLRRLLTTVVWLWKVM